MRALDHGELQLPSITCTTCTYPEGKVGPRALRTKSQPVKMGTEPQVKVYVTCMSVCTHVHIDNGRETVQLLNGPIFKDSRKDFLSSFSTIFQF